MTEPIDLKAKRELREWRELARKIHGRLADVEQTVEMT